MIRSIRAELRKIWTVRSTYAIIILLLLLSVGAIGFWAYGYKDAGHAAQNSRALVEALYTAISFGLLFMSFVALLSVGHEYRYNTILYSLTSVNRRGKFFLAKWFAVVVSAMLMAAFVVALAATAFYIGQQAHHINTLSQTTPDWNFAWRILVSVTGFVSFAFIIGMLLRSQVAAIAAFLIVPSTVESLLGLILKDNVKYLPFTALGNLADPATKIPVMTSLSVVGGYIVGFGLLTYVLFLRRDAN